MSMNTFSSVFQWLNITLIELEEWMEYLPKAGDGNG